MNTNTPHELATLAALAQTRRHAEATAADARNHLASAIVDAHYNGTKQADIARVTGYTRETIRRLVKAFEEESAKPDTTEPAELAASA